MFLLSKLFNTSALLVLFSISLTTAPFPSPTLSSKLDFASAAPIAVKSMPYLGLVNEPVILMGMAKPAKAFKSAPSCPLSELTIVGFAK